MIWIIGGNSDARILTSLIKEPYLLTTATKDGEKFYWNQGGFEKENELYSDGEIYRG